jgi:hypothetical protein
MPKRMTLERAREHISEFTLGEEFTEDMGGKRSLGKVWRKKNG